MQSVWRKILIVEICRIPDLSVLLLKFKYRLKLSIMSPFRTVTLLLWQQRKSAGLYQQLPSYLLVYNHHIYWNEEFSFRVGLKRFLNKLQKLSDQKHANSFKAAFNPVVGLWSVWITSYSSTTQTEFNHHSVKYRFTVAVSNNSLPSES